MRSLRRHRGLLALVLLVTLPLRGFAMTTSCCPIVAESTNMESMTDASMATPTGVTHDAHAPDDHHGAPPACCTVALPATTAAPSLPDYVPPRARSPHPSTIAAWPTEPPERPPRPIA